MARSRSARARRGPRRHSRGAAAAVIVTALTASTLAAAPVAGSAPSDDCPLPFPVADVGPDMSVRGKTVSTGTEPEEFTGTVLGVIDDGIAPGLDMIMAELDSEAIRKAGGIWQGMSGSPVYTRDGKLIGAVAYGLSWGPSPIAGITPAEEMYRLLSAPPTDPVAAASLEAAAESDEVALPSTLRRELVSSGVLARDEADAGLSRLPMPLGISGMVNSKRLGQAKNALDLPDVRAYRAGGVSALTESVPVVAGGNVAASLSYGDVSAMGVGTATAVCGEEVLAFGHPMMFSGPSQLTMHGADAVYVQPDSAWAPFKVANPAAPVGAVTQDRLPGLLGVQNPAAVPSAAAVTSYVEVPGEWSRTGTTRISVPDAVPDIAAFHLVADQDRVFDSIGAGSTRVSWRISGTRADGEPFSLFREDRFANDWDISYEPSWDLYDHLARLHYFEAEDITLSRVATRSTMTRRVDKYKVVGLRVKRGDRYVAVRSDRPLLLRGGTKLRLRVVLSSPTLGTKRVSFGVPVPRRIGYKSGYLEIVGGNGYWPEGGGDFEDEMFWGEESSAPSQTFDQLLTSLRREPRNDQVLANLRVFRRGNVIRRSVRVGAGAVVDGRRSAEVQGIG